MHSNLLHELIWIQSDVKPNSAKFDSAITDLADIVFTSKDYDEILSEMEDIYIHEGNGSNFRFGFAGFYLLSVIYRRACDRQNCSRLLRMGLLDSKITSISSLYILAAMSFVILLVSHMLSC